ncbi:hypothetical protein [uncultured Arcticibacterium sp.]|uniref:hypothetical protein n=1 Tax=uncultured Arcticibacterium sp. TaxID=2173042 RepID=UPI0030F55B17
MKKSIFVAALLLPLSTLLTGCAAIAGIFKAGMNFGIILVLIVIGLLLYFGIKMRKK